MYNQNVSRSTSKLDTISSMSGPSSRGNNNSNSHYSSLTSPSKSHHNNHSYHHHGSGSGTDPRRHAAVSVHQTGATPSSQSSSSLSSSSKMLSPRRSRSSGTDSTSSQGSRSSSPMDMSIDSLQSVSSSAYNLSHSFVMDGRTSPNPSLYDSRSSSMTSVLSLMRDRSLERTSDSERSPSGVPEVGRYPIGISVSRDLASRDLAPTSSASVRERRSGGYQQLSSSPSSRDRSLDREYPHMGARSLERDYSYHHRRPTERADTLPSPHSGHSQSVMEQRLKDQLIFELQNQISDLNQDCLKFQRDAENAADKLSSCMNSIKTFWSPELKKERALRKEEANKCNSLNEGLKVTQAELKRQSSIGKEFQLQLDQARQSVSHHSLSEQEMDNMKQEQDKQGKEILILRKTVEEMEIRIATQKQTLSARDESIKKLLEMLQSKGLGVKQLDADRVEIETLRNLALEEEKRRKQLESVLAEKAKEVAKMREENGILSNQLKNAQFQMQSLPSNSHTMQAMLEAKDSRISALERDIQVLEDKLLSLQEDISVGDKSWKLDLSSGKDTKTSADTRALKVKIDHLRESLGRKETELCGLRLQVDTLEKQYSEQQEYILVLKEQISAREKQTSIIGSEVDDLRVRMKDKDSTIERKSKQTQMAQREKKKFEAELADLRDHLDIKERKVNVLQRKIQTLEDELADKETQLNNAQSRVATITADSTDSALSSMEESLSEKERLIDRLRDQRERVETELTEENTDLREQNQLYLKQIDSLNLEINEKQTQLCEAREEAAELRSQKMMSDSMINQLKMEMTDNSKESEELETLKEKLEKIKKELAEANNTADSLSTKNSQEMDVYKQETEKLQTDIESLRQQLKDSEAEQSNKDSTIKDLQDHVKEYRQKMGTLKRSNQTEKKKSAQMLEEARKREVVMDGDASQLKSIMRQRDDRVEELEEALRESVKITAEREMVMAEQESKIQQTEMRLYELSDELEKMNAIQSDHIAKVGALTRQLEEKDSKLRRFQSERHKQLEEVYEMKQEAIQAAISEKDANIALLEMTSTKKQRNTEDMSRLEKEKEKLALQLKELTETRMRLVQKKNDHSSGSQKSLVHRMKGATDEQVIRAVRKIEHSKKRLRTLIDQLLAAVLDTDPQLLEGLPRIQQGPSVSVATLRTLSSEEIRLELHKSDRDCQKLQDYANILLQRVGASCPELLDNFVSMMESSDTESCQST